MKKVLCIAHRGASGYEPENTLRAIRTAITMGADMVEVDVRPSRDGYLMVIHDETVDRTTDGSGYVENMSLNELKKLDAGMNEKIPILEEVVETIKGKVKLVVELKKAGMEEKVVKIFEQTNMVEEVIVTSFIHESVKKVKELNQKIKTGIIFKCTPINPVKLAREAKADVIFPEYRYTTEEMIKKIHDEGLTVYIWTINNRQLADSFIETGVDGIVTDKPDILSQPEIKKPKKVFISGPIQGMEKRQFYRKKLGKMLKDMGFEVLDPWEREKIVYSSRGGEWWKEVPIKGLVKRDLEDIDRCDFLVAYVPKPSVGTSMELFYAKNKNKPTYVICKMKNPSPWIVAHST
ncbi:hypothetical protein DRO26_04925, partial [Candidatus Bathyarchaeota archaeon]